MSSKPDGSDPRILQKEGTTVYIATTITQSKKTTYHEKGCPVLDKLNTEPTEIDVSVAKWKGYEKCNHCQDPTSSTLAPAINGPEVDRIRRALVEGYTSKTVGSGRDMNKTTVRYHAKAHREYNYPTEPKTPVVEYKGNQWVWSE